MGLFMTRNLRQRGFVVKGYDVTDFASKRAADDGVLVQSTIAETVKDVDYVVTCLPKTEHVAEALRSDEGIFANATAGTFICDTSTINPKASEEFAAESGKHGVTFLDTPMSGGVSGAEAGTLTFMVGGSEENFELVKPVLMGMGKNVFHCGGPGTGEIAKIVNNMILGISMIAVAEGFAIGEKLGADPKLLQQICAVSTSRSWVMDTMHPVPGVLPNAPASKNYDVGFQCGLIKKDMALAMTVADQCDADSSICEFTHDYYEELERLGKGAKDFGYTYQYISNNKKLPGQ